MHIGVDLAEPGSERTVYTVGGVSYAVRPGFYLASCDDCGWVGSSEECGTDIDSDVFCPKCHKSGADCGAVATAAGVVERKVAIANRK